MSTSLLDEPLGSLDDAQPIWSELAAGADNLFSTWEWADTWWRHFGTGRSLDLRCLRDHLGRAIAVLPCYRERRATIWLTRLIGQGLADQLGPICAPADFDLAQQALGRSGGDLLLAESLPAERDWDGLGGSVMQVEPSPVLEIAAGAEWEDYLSTRSAKLRESARRRRRRLSGPLRVSFRLTRDRDDLDTGLDALIALHNARWDGSSLEFVGRRAQFHRDFAAVALERGWLRLWLAEAEGRVIAASYGFRFAGAEYGYQFGRDPAWDRAGIGAGLIEHMIREAFADGVREFRMLRGGEGYKRAYATGTRHVVTIARPLSVVGRAALAGARGLAASSRGRRLLRAAAI